MQTVLSSYSRLSCNLSLNWLFSFHSGKHYFPTAGYYLAKQEFSYEIVTNLVQIFLRVSARIVDYLSCTQSLNSFESIFLLELLFLEDIEM